MKSLKVFIEHRGSRMYHSHTSPTRQVVNTQHVISSNARRRRSRLRNLKMEACWSWLSLHPQKFYKVGNFKLGIMPCKCGGTMVRLQC